MSDSDRKNSCGQSLVEFLVVLPLLILFLAAIFPLLSAGVWAPWLDERLWLGHFIQENRTIQLELHDTHRMDRVSAYFLQGDLEETTSLKKVGITFPAVEKFYPRYLMLKKIVASPPENKWATPEISYRLDEKFLRKLAIITPSLSYNSDIPFIVRELSLLGIFPWKIKALENLNFKLFHLNLDALPDTDSEA